MSKVLVKCGDANPKGNVMLTYKGGCTKELDVTEAYRCVGCGGWFHLDCILKHFQLEEGHDISRTALKKIRKLTRSKKIKNLCNEGLKPTKPIKNYAKRNKSNSNRPRN